MRYFVLLGIFFLFSCEDISTFDVDNPFDPQNPTYVAPSVTIKSGPSENEIITVPNTAFSWVGNTEGMSFRYFLNGKLKQDWIDTTSVLLDYLDEGTYQFGLQSKYPTGDASDTIYVNFNVNAVLGPSLLFNPRKHVAVLGETVTFQILAEEVIGLSGAEFKVDYDPSMFQIESVTQGTLFQSGTQSIFHVDHNTTQGSFFILMAILDTETPSVDGTGVLAEVVVKLLNQGTANLSFGSTNKFRDPDNTEITIREKIGGIVIAQ